MSVTEEEKNDLIADNVKLVLDGRQESAVRRFSTCEKWGILLLHKVGTGKTITSLLIALNAFRKLKRSTPLPGESIIEEPYKIMCIAPVGIYAGFIRDIKNNILFNNVGETNPTSGETIFNFFDIQFQVIDYNYDLLIFDINRKHCRSFKETIIIMDEAHRLLTSDINNPTEAGGAMKKHSLIEDLFFRTRVAEAKMCITMSGTPMQQSPADLCRFGNFLTQTNTFTTEKYAKKQANLVWATFIIKNISYVQATTSFLATIGKTLFMPVVATELAAPGTVSNSPILYTAVAIATLATVANIFAIKGLKSITNKQLSRSEVKTFGGQRKTKLRLKSDSSTKTKKANKHSRNQHGGDPPSASLINIAAIASKLNELGIPDYIKTRLPDSELLKKAKSGVAGLVDTAIASATVDNATKLTYSVGPGLVGDVASSMAFQNFAVDSTDALNTILEPVYDMKLLATDLSPYMSIYDYELQDTLNLACLEDINAKFQEILPGKSVDYYKINGKDNATNAPLYTFTAEENLKALVEINKLKKLAISDKNSVQRFSERGTPFEKNYPKCNMPKDPTLTEIDKSLVDTRFPEQILSEVSITFSDYQMKFIMDFCLGIIDDDTKEMLNLNKYEKISIDFKEKLDYFVKNLKFVSSFTQDVKDYYAYIDSLPDDPNFRYNKYKYALRAKALKEGKPAEKANIFECEKFITALGYINQVNTGKLPVSRSFGEKINDEEKIKNEKGIIYELDSFYIHPAHGGDRYKFEDASKNIRSKDEEDTGKYLPVVYSYNEDFGLALFANYLESQGKKYILVSKLQEKVAPKFHKLQLSSGEKTFDDLLEYNKYMGFEMTYQGNPEDPVCVLIDPTMTEGLNAKYNPAILVLEACNTFGDSEQVYGRVLRKYGDPYASKKNKVIYQFVTSMKNDNDSWTSIINKNVGPLKTKVEVLVKTLREQYRLGNTKSFTVSEYNIASSQFKYISPDDVCRKKIIREANNLRNFEKEVRHTVQYADLFETVECDNRPPMKGGNNDKDLLFNLNPDPTVADDDLYYTDGTKETADQLKEAVKSLENLNEEQVKEIIFNAKEEIQILEENVAVIYLKMLDQLKTKLESDTNTIERGSAEEQTVLKEFMLGYSNFIVNNMKSEEYKTQLQAIRNSKKSGVIGYLRGVIGYLKNKDAVPALVINESRFDAFLNDIIDKVDFTKYEDAIEDVSKEIENYAFIREDSNNEDEFFDAKEIPFETEKTDGGSRHKKTRKKYRKLRHKSRRR